MATDPPRFLDWPGPIAFAHRGGAALNPENTVAAFQAAVDLGFRYVETDVRVTADGVLVAFHDERLERMTDGTGRLEDQSWADLRRARVGGVHELVRFEDLLGTWPDLRINVDPKMDAAVGPLCDAIARTGALERVCVASFSDRRLRAVRRRLGPRLCTGVGPAGIARVRLRAGGWPGTVAGDCLQVPTRWGRVRVVDRRSVLDAHRAGLAVHVWTVDDPAEMHRLLDLGVDGLMTDRPDLLKEVLVARGQWW